MRLLTEDEWDAVITLAKGTREAVVTGNVHKANFLGSVLREIAEGLIQLNKE